MAKRCGGEAVLLPSLTDAIDVVHMISSDRRAMVVVARPYTITLKVTAFGPASAREFLRDIAAIAVRRCQIPLFLWVSYAPMFTWIKGKPCFWAKSVNIV